MSKQHRYIPRRTVRRLAALPVVLALSVWLYPGSSANASSAVPVTPFVDCVGFNGDSANPIYTAYFGYNNTGPVEFNFDIGADNNVFPGATDAGQPRTFTVGNDPRVFEVKFDGAFIPTVDWELNGVTAEASVHSPACVSEVTAPASDVASTSATLNGVVTPDGEDTTYSFEYGPSASLGASTPVEDAGAGPAPELEQAAVTALMPSTQYFFRLDATNAWSGTTRGQLQTFTTSASGIPTAITATSPAQMATVGKAFTHALQAKVVDAAGLPVANAQVTFAAPGTGASGSFPGGSSTAIVLTDASGLATAPTLTANTISGSYAVTAAVSGGATHALFALTNVARSRHRAATTTVVTSSAHSAFPDQRVTYTAIVRPMAPAAGTPAGRVRFTDNGARISCGRRSSVHAPASVATCTRVYRTAGRHSIVARYQGNDDFLPSQSRTISEVIVTLPSRR